MWQNIVVELLILGFIPKRHCSQRVRYPKTHVLHGQGCKPAPSFLFLTRGFVGGKDGFFFCNPKKVL